MMARLGSLQNMMAANAAPLAPEVGMGATEVIWTDRAPFTVVEIKGPKTIVLRADKVTPKPFPNGYAASIDPDPNGYMVTIRLRKDGRWRSTGGTTFYVGTRDYYRDPSF